MILTGRHVGAAEGQRLGFVNEVVPQGELIQAARRWASLIIECSPAAVRASKQATLRALQEPTLQTPSARGPIRLSGLGVHYAGLAPRLDER